MILPERYSEFSHYHDSYNGFNMKAFLFNTQGEDKEFLSSYNFDKHIIKGKSICPKLLERGFIILTKSQNYDSYSLLIDGEGTLSFYHPEQRMGIKLNNYVEYEDGNDKIGVLHEAINVALYFKRSTQFLEDLINDIKDDFAVSENKKHINFLAKNSNGFYLNSIELNKKIEIDFELNYNDDFNYQKIEKHINNKDNGLILLGGVAGSGKSSYLKYLIHTIERPFLFVPNQYIELLISPDFIAFAVSNLKDYVLILEDCENILLSRTLNKTSSVPIILNLTSGIIGDILNLTIIGTFNTKDQIDSALFRKGRLLYEYQFENLSVEKCEKLSEKLGFDKKYDQAVTLADVYNIEDNKIEVVKKTIGYK